MDMKKYFAFIGVLVVGVLMIGLVSGAGYNIVVPTIVVDDGSSGGGGGGAVTNVTNATINETISSEGMIGAEDASAETSSIDEGIGEKIVNIISDAKNSWGWIGVTLVILVVLVGAFVYFKKRQ